jgi:hypothetical protein
VTEPINGRWQRDVDRRLDRLEERKYDVMENRMVNLEAAVREIKDGQKAAGRVSWTLAVAFIAFTLTLAVSIATGNVG